VALNATLLGARPLPDGIELAYSSRSRVFNSISRKPVRLKVDGRETAIEVLPGPGGTYAISLPWGKHVAIIQ
jgi:hypothetical protein